MRDSEALRAVAPEPWGLKDSYEALYSYTTHDKDKHSRVLGKCNTKIIALNCGAFQFLKWPKKDSVPSLFSHQH